MRPLHFCYRCLAKKHQTACELEFLFNNARTLRKLHKEDAFVCLVNPGVANEEEWEVMILCLAWPRDLDYRILFL